MVTLEEQIEAVDRLVTMMRSDLCEMTAQRLEAARGTLLEVDARLKSGVFCKMFPQCVRTRSVGGMVPECRRPSCPGLVALTVQGVEGHDYDIGRLVQAAQPALEKWVKNSTAMR